MARDPDAERPENYDVIVVGAGPGGYVAAIRCAQLGLRTACIDNQVNAAGKATLGGTCLNVGCIPSKALLDSSEQFHKLNHHFALHGITADNAAIDIGVMQDRKKAIVDRLTTGIAGLFKVNGVSFVHGHGRLGANHSVQVSDANGELLTTLSADNIILAPGSTPVALPGIPFDHERVVDSTGALAFTQVPARLGIIGAGVIGLELGSVWNRLGAAVVILEAMEEFLGAADRHIAREGKKQFDRQGLDIRLGAKVTRVESDPESITLYYEQQGESHTLEVDRVIVAVGRAPATDGLLAPDCGVAVDARGFIEVDAQCRTAVAGVWAVGDAVRGPMLAHKSAEEGVAVAECIAGGNGHINLATVPWVIYTAPEIAWVGQTEHELKSAGSKIRTGIFPFAATGRALAMAEPVGMVKIVADADTDRILGVHAIGPHVSELIAECVVAMEFHASSEDLARIIHAHPTLSEAVHEAALAVDKRAIHKGN